MAQYVLILRDDPRQYDSYSPDQMQATIARYGTWAQELGERHAGGQKLAGADAAAVLRRDGDRTVVTDGPFGETKEMIGGFFIIEADDLAQAIELCRNHPQLEDKGTVEIRQVDDLTSCASETAGVEASAGR
ncbi:YciI family protein [Engelhardtia mirabilis]|uniref:YCII-related domain protein n=1 Tax=Engelhardtia mirabilis TaxID=2528011 RepID=A0A518BFK8_9BACT|nr:YCII-related domain protein [Planctomycetes bacterium Pla133]QDV00095.1 YCII-related domain protein [Planctomycetes bacterium Pla86]